MMMHEILSRLNVDLLKRLIDDYYCGSVLKIIDSNKLNEWQNDCKTLVSLVLATYGNDLFYDKTVRRLFLETLPSNKLVEIAQHLNKPKYQKKYDLASTIANSPWRYGSSLTRIFVREFQIPSDYLPNKSSSMDSTEIVDPFEDIPDLLEYQEQIKVKLERILSSEGSRALLHMPTGSGKTRTVLDSAIDYFLQNNIFEKQQSILWFAHTEELCNQAIDAFKDIWQKNADRSARIVRYWGGYKPMLEELRGSFIVGSLQKFYNIVSKEEEIFKTINECVCLVVIDEAHKALAPTYNKVLSKLTEDNKKVLIGLSATPGRGAESDIENRELSILFGKTLIAPYFEGRNPIDALKDMGVLSNVKRIVRPSKIVINLNEDEMEYAMSFADLPTTVLSRLARDNNRNKLIISILREQLANNNSCLVFACSVEHSRLLSAAVNFLGFKAAHIDCTMRRGSRRYKIENFKRGKLDVLINYGILSTGFDAPKTKTIIITRPTNSIVLYSQMVGRGLRGPLMGGTEHCDLIDIKDNYENFGDVDKVYEYFSDYWEK